MISTRMIGGGHCVLRSAEGGTSGKNSTTDQHQSQNTTGTTGDNSPSVSAQDGGSINLGTVVNGNASFTDQGAIEKAFQFGEASLGVLAGAGDKLASIQKDNTNFLSGVLGSFSAQTDAGQSAVSQKNILYIAAGVLALVAVIFVFRKS